MTSHRGSGERGRDSKADRPEKVDWRVWRPCLRARSPDPLDGCVNGYRVPQCKLPQIRAPARLIYDNDANVCKRSCGRAIGAVSDRREDAVSAAAAAAATCMRNEERVQCSNELSSFSQSDSPGEKIAELELTGAGAMTLSGAGLEVQDQSTNHEQVRVTVTANDGG